MYLGTSYAAHHVAAVEHTRSAMDYKVIGGEVVGKISTTYNVNCNLLAQLAAKHTRQLHAANIFVLGSMCAGFGYKDSGRWGE